LTGMVFGLAPALQASRQDLTASLKEGGRSATGSLRQGRMRNLLVVCEIALALILLIGAGLMIRSFRQLLRVDPGFDPHNLLTMQIDLPESKYKDETQIANFYSQVLGRLETLPGVSAVGATWRLPLSGSDSGTGIEVEGHEASKPGEGTRTAFSSVSPRYFQTMGIPVIKGRAFTEQDNANAPGAVIINETFARTYFPGVDAIGKRIRRNESWLTVVGVAADVKHVELSAAPRPEMYLSYLQTPFLSMYLAVRTGAADPASLTTAIRKEVWAIDQDQPVAEVETMDQLVAHSVARTRFNTLLLAVFAVVALMLAAVGVYGIMAYSVTQRTHEIGIRMALGAQHRDIFRMVVGQGMVLATAGISIGLAAAFGLTRLMSSLLFGVSATDPVTFAMLSLTLALVALLATYLPARRAMRVDPMEAHRYE